MTSQRVRDMVASADLAGSELFYADNGSQDVKVSASLTSKWSRKDDRNYIDIRDYGTVVDGGDITAAWAAACNDAGNHKVKRIRVPRVGFGNYTLDGATLLTATVNKALTMELDCDTISLTSTLRISSNQKWIGIGARSGVSQQFFNGQVPGPGIGMINGINQITCETYDLTGGGVTNWELENLQFGGNDVNGVGLHVLGGSLASIKHCWFTSGGPGNPLNVDTIFWLTMQDIYAQPRSAGDFAAIRFSTDSNNATLACGLIRAKEIKTSRSGIEFVSSGPASAPVENIEIYDFICEGLLGGNSLIRFDSTIQQVAQIKLIRCEVADAVFGTCYLLKNTGSAANSTSGIHIEDPGLPTFAGAVQFWDPASNWPIDNLTLNEVESDNYSGATPVQLASIYAATSGKQFGWRRDYRHTIDAKVLTTPIPGCNWNYGTPYAVNTDPSTWTATTGAITTGRLGPDGSTMAAKCTGRTVLFSGSDTLALGDWLIGGVWCKSDDGTGAANNTVALGTNPAGTWEFNNHDLTFYPFDDPSDSIIADGWKLIFGASKVTKAGTNPATVALECNIDGNTNRRFFGPAALKIPASAGVEDGWIFKICRSLRGGWSGFSPAGTVSIYDHQRFWSGSGLAIKDHVTAPSAVSGWAQLYVDTADGSLKVKFGNGTVKTITTNP